MKAMALARVSLIASWVLLASAASPVSAATYHLAPDGSGDFPTIQAAIDAASSGDEIVLADGTFTGDGNWDVEFGTKELVLRSANGYEATFLDGGFDPVHNDLWHRGLVLEGGQTAATRIEGLTFQHSRGFYFEGGSIRCVGASPTIRGVRIWENSQFARGAGIFVQGGSPTIEDCIFDPNMYGAPEGSAICGQDSWLSVRRCWFHLKGQGVVSLDGGTIEDCTFMGIRGVNDEQGKCLRAAAGQVSVQRCLFRNNFSVGVEVLSPAQVLVGSCEFRDNVNDHGSGLMSGGGVTIVRNTTFTHNYSGHGGGIVYCYGGSSTVVALDHCVFLDNTNGWPGDGSAVSAYGTELRIENCTFVGNRTASSGERGSTITIWSGTHLLMNHTIVALGGQPGMPDGAIHCEGPPGSLVVTCSDFFGNEGGDWTGCVAGMETSNGNLSADPLFCDLAAGDLSLRGNSPCAPASTGECGLIGALGPWCGPLAVEPRSWGSIKALYR